MVNANLYEQFPRYIPFISWLFDISVLQQSDDVTIPESWNEEIEDAWLVKDGERKGDESMLE